MVLLCAFLVVSMLYIFSRLNESSRLTTKIKLAAELKATVGDDIAREVAVKEFETHIFERLFVVTHVNPRIITTMWSLSATVIAVMGLISLHGERSSLLENALYWLLIVAATVFAITFIYTLVATLYVATSTPRISFVDDDEDDQLESEISVEDTSTIDDEDEADLTEGDTAESVTQK